MQYEKKDKLKKEGFKEIIMEAITNKDMKRIDFVVESDIKNLEQREDKLFIKKITGYYVLKELKNKILSNLALSVLLTVGLFVTIAKPLIGSIFIVLGIMFLIYSALAANKYAKYLTDKYFN